MRFWTTEEAMWDPGSPAWWRHFLGRGGLKERQSGDGNQEVGFFVFGRPGGHAQRVVPLLLGEKCLIIRMRSALGHGIKRCVKCVCILGAQGWDQVGSPRGRA